MAIRTNTIEYGWETEKNVITITGSIYTTPYRTIYIPETSSRVFSDVTLLFHGRNVGNENSTTTFSCSIQVQIDNNPTSSGVSMGNVGNQTVEQISATGLFQFSQYFNTYFTASSHNVRWYFQSPSVAFGVNLIGHTFKPIITYAFDDSNITKSIKTVRLPINTVSSSTGLLVSGEVYLGNYTASIPALETYCPENDKTFRDIFIEYHANDASTSTAGFSLRTRIDGGSQVNRVFLSQSQQSGAYYYDIQNLSGSINTSTTHSIRVGTTTTNRFTGLCGILYATYEYDYTGSSKLLHSNIYSMGAPQISTGRAFFSNYQKTVYIPEPGPIELKRSAILTQQIGSAFRDMDVNITTESYCRYVHATPSITTGQAPLMHQIDGTGSLDNSIISLNSGYNTVNFYFDYAVTTTGTPIQLGGLLYLNYISSRSLGYPLQYPHTINNSIDVVNNSTILSGGVSAFYIQYSGSIYVGDSSYYIDDLTNAIHVRCGKVANVPIYSIHEWVCYYTSSDIYVPNENPYKIATTAFNNDARYEFFNVYSDMTNQIVKYPQYTQVSDFPKLNLNFTHSYQCRNISVSSNAITGFNHQQYITYRSLQFQITGSIVNYSGSGAGIPIFVYDYDRGTKLFETQSLAGGQINTYWYDRHTNLLLIAQTGSRYLSNILPAGSGSFTITIPTQTSPGTGGEKSLTFIT